MQKYYCDVCGTEMPEGYKPPELIQSGGIEDLCKVYDVCPVCNEAGKSFNVSEVLLERWRNIVFPSAAKEG